MSRSDPEFLRAVLSSCNSLAEMESLFISYRLTIWYLDATHRSKSTAGTILQRCLTNVEKFKRQMGGPVCVYKIGITTNPLLRSHFYGKGNYCNMSLLHVTENMGVAQMLEAALISMHLSERGCRNERFGGDGPAHAFHEKFHFVYIVGAWANGRKRIS